MERSLAKVVALFFALLLLHTTTSELRQTRADLHNPYRRSIQLWDLGHGWSGDM